MFIYYSNLFFQMRLSSSIRWPSSGQIFAPQRSILLFELRQQNSSLSSIIIYIFFWQTDHNLIFLTPIHIDQHCQFSGTRNKKGRCGSDSANAGPRFLHCRFGMHIDADSFGGRRSLPQQITTAESRESEPKICVLNKNQT